MHNYKGNQRLNFNNKEKKIEKVILSTLTYKMHTQPKNWGNTVNSQQQQTLMHSFISAVTSTGLEDMNNIVESLSGIDKMLSKVIARQCYDPRLVEKQVASNQNLQPNKLSLPKGNTLTDALIRNTLGCDQKYAKQYMQLLGEKEQDFEKKKRIDQIKKMFTQSNSFIDISANSKPFLPNKANYNSRPVVDNQHEGYLKTQLIFLEKPNNKKIDQRKYYEKHYDTITQKIQELGGMQDTLSKMEATLKNNEISNFKNSSILKEVGSSPKNNSFFQNKNIITPSEMKVDQSWLQKSKQLRQKFQTKANN